MYTLQYEYVLRVSKKEKDMFVEIPTYSIHQGTTFYHIETYEKEGKHDIRLGSTKRRYNEFAALKKDLNIALPPAGSVFNRPDLSVRQKQLCSALNTYLKEHKNSDIMDKFLNCVRRRGETKTSTQSLKSRPCSYPDDPTEVEVNYFINMISSISAAESTFEADFYLDLYWTDKRLIGMDGDDLTFGEGQVWIPEIEFPNGRDVEKDFENYILESKSGHVTYQTRIRATFTANMSLEKFPFDRQCLSISMESGAHEASEVVLCNFNTKLHLTQELRENGLAEWQICTLSEKSKVTELEFDGSKYSTFTIKILLARRPGYYISKIIVPFTLIVAMSLSVYAMDPSEIGDRIGTSIEAALTATAFQVAINDSLPRVGYMTVLDKFIMCTFSIMCLSCAVTVYAYREHNANPEWIANIDMYCFRFSLTMVLLSLTYIFYENSSN